MNNLIINNKFENKPNSKYMAKEVNNVGNITMELGDTIWVVRHTYTSPMDTIFNGIDGIFYDLSLAKKAKVLCEHDKPSWKFYLEDYKIITDIYDSV